MPSHLLVPDATNLAHRAWHAAAGKGTAETTAATVERWIRNAAERVHATHVIAAFDGPKAGAARYTMHPEYKAGRTPKDENTRHALAQIPELLATAGIPTTSPAEAEADDVLAAYATQPGSTTLLTSDKDALGLLAHPDTTVLRPASGGTANWTLLTAHDLHADTGVHATDWTLYAALKGDSSDNIPGVTGIGPGLAVKLAAALHTLENFEEDLRSGGPITRLSIGQARTDKLTANLDTTLARLHLSARLAAPLPVTELPNRDAIPTWEPSAHRAIRTTPRHPQANSRANTLF